MANRGRYGARVYLMDGKKILVYQTIKQGSEQNARYIVFPKTQQGVFSNINDDKNIANAIRDALSGKLP
jgi:hypothetical protein